MWRGRHVIVIKRITMKRPPIIERVISWPVVEAGSRRRGWREVAFSSTVPLQFFHAHPLIAIHRRGREGALKRRLKVWITDGRPHRVVREMVVVVEMIKLVLSISPPKVLQFL